MAYTYILYSISADRYYVGSTDSTLEERLRKHLSKHKGYTGKFKDWVVVYSKEYTTVNRAREFERQIKSMKDRAYILGLIKGSGHPG